MAYTATHKITDYHSERATYELTPLGEGAVIEVPARQISRDLTRLGVSVLLKGKPHVYSKNGVWEFWKRAGER